MILNNVYEAKFVERLNRFVWKGILDWKETLFHIGDTGRLTELLTNWNEILIQRLEWNKRKYNFRLIGAKNLVNDWILLNSLLHSKLVEQYLQNLSIKYKKEVKVWDSRIDFLLIKEKEFVFVEVKWCSLMKKLDDLDIQTKNLILVDKFWYKNFVGLFPDAPTERGVKHLTELINLLKEWKRAEIWFLMMNKVKYFAPNIKTHPEFGVVFDRFLKSWGKVRFFQVILNFDLNKKQVKISLL